MPTSDAPKIVNWAVAAIKENPNISDSTLLRLYKFTHAGFILLQKEFFLQCFRSARNLSENNPKNT